MINKKSVWFLTLFSLIIVLSVYYITMPTELLISNDKPKEVNKPTIDVEESTILVSLRLEEEEKVLNELNNLNKILNGENSIEEKNKAFEKIKNINIKKSEEQKLEKLILKEFNFKSFVKINNNQIEIVVKNDKFDNVLANKIMRSIQNNYKEQKYITIKFIK